jgi:transcriptional regulator with XRE-family HTH domain
MGIFIIMILSAEFFKQTEGIYPTRVDKGIPMIDPAQIRAARGLLHWNQTDLHNAADISVNWISQIESGEATGSIEILETIQGAFEKAGVEFLPRSGVRKKDIVDIYEGPKFNERLIEDIYKTLSGSASGANREILIAHLNEHKSIKNLGKTFIEEQIRLRKEAGITHRLLVRANDPGLIPPLNTYHIMPDKYFSEYMLWIYGSKLALLAWEPETGKPETGKSVVIDEERFADCARKLFDFIWDNTDPVEEVSGEGTSSTNKGNPV